MPTTTTLDDELRIPPPPPKPANVPLVPAILAALQAGVRLELTERRWAA